MVTVRFVVEGDCEKLLVDDENFRKWLLAECNLKVIDPAVSADGAGNLCGRNIGKLIRPLRKQKNLDKIVVLADLDPDECAKCITERKKIIGETGIDLVVIARKSLESWFLADTAAMRRWCGDKKFEESRPEETPDMPWNRLKEIKSKDNIGPGRNKKYFAKKFIRRYGFDVRRAAKHPHCPSAKYFVNEICKLGGKISRDLIP